MRKVFINAAAIAFGTLCLSTSVAGGPRGVEGQQNVETAAGAKQNPPRGVIQLREMALSGTVVKVVKEGQEGKPERVLYLLEADDGSRIRLPALNAHCRRKGKTQELDLAPHEGRRVTITCMGLERKKGDTTRIVVRSIKSIEATGTPEAP